MVRTGSLCELRGVFFAFFAVKKLLPSHRESSKACNRKGREENAPRTHILAAVASGGS
jgi:hypothetical protein